jgi:hypothetical protein
MRQAARHSRASQRVRFENFEVYVRAGELRKDGARIHLQEQPFQVLTVLLEHAGELHLRFMHNSHCFDVLRPDPRRFAPAHARCAVVSPVAVRGTGALKMLMPTSPL